MIKQKRIMAGALAVLMLAGAAGCGKETAEEEEAAQGTAVEVQEVAVGEMASQSAIAGTVTARKSVQVFPLLSGNVTALNVEKGDTVTQGQLLFQVDTSTVTSTYASLQQSYNATKAATDEGIATARLSVQNAQIGVDNAQIQVDQAKRALDNAEALHAAGAVGDQDLKTAQEGYTQAQAALASAQSSVQQAQAAVQQAQASQQASLAQIQASMAQIEAQAKLGTVTAPVSGLVTEVNLERGGLAAQSAPAVVIAEGGEIEVTVEVSETVYAGLKAGDRGEITIQSVSAEPLDGTIASLAPAADAQTKLYEVKLSLPADVKPAIGAFASVTLFTDQRADAVYVPTEAILTDGETQYLFILTEEAPEAGDGEDVGEGPWAQKVTIETGLVGDGITEVTSGLSGGESLVVKGQSYLSDGALVRIVSGEDA